ncbi:hypothetical protein V9T40_007310 [Parthenolecanium corni]|uniref:Large ribosomal subunit protein mL37 n=1 Tax=Parthenolecanium corni TaxID=536013 RepID=A0AAN9TV35_9HEMI
MIRWKRYQLFQTGKRKIVIRDLLKQMNAANVPLEAATEVVKENVYYPGKRLETRGIRKLPPKLDSSHPNWKETPCLVNRDHNVLVGGLNQAKIFTNSVETKEGLPSQIESLYDADTVDKHIELVQMAFASALVYDTTQLRLPVRKDPERPAWVFPREYGITDQRKNYVLCNRLIHLCELIAGLDVSQNRYKFEDAYFSLPLLRDEDVIQSQIRADLLILSKDSLKSLENPEQTLNTELPDISPMKYTISLPEENLYELENIFPLTENASFKHVHTAIIHFNATEVHNLYKTPVLESQTTARSLMKAFTIAAAQARYLYGENVQRLPEPVVVQCIQTDAKYFHFCVFQLNTLEWSPSNQSVRNIFWSEPVIPAYEFGGYFEGQPTITSFNKEVFKKFLAFYLHR